MLKKLLYLHLDEWSYSILSCLIVCHCFPLTEWLSKYGIKFVGYPFTVFFPQYFLNGKLLVKWTLQAEEIDMWLSNIYLLSRMVMFHRVSNGCITCMAWLHNSLLFVYCIMHFFSGSCKCREQAGFIDSPHSC